MVWARWLLVAIPVSWALAWLDAPPLGVFIAAGLAVVPLAAEMGAATETLAARCGPATGGLLNATCGNAAELIVAIVALRAGLVHPVPASRAGDALRHRGRRPRPGRRHGARSTRERAPRARDAGRRGAFWVVGAVPWTHRDSPDRQRRRARDCGSRGPTGAERSRAPHRAWLEHAGGAVCRSRTGCRRGGPRTAHEPGVHHLRGCGPRARVPHRHDYRPRRRVTLVRRSPAAGRVRPPCDRGVVYLTREDTRPKFRPARPLREDPGARSAPDDSLLFAERSFGT